MKHSFKLKMACSNSLQTFLAVDFPRPNCNPQPLYLLPVASQQSAKPTLFMLTGTLNLICSFHKCALVKSHKYSKVFHIITLKCSFQRKFSAGLQQATRPVLWTWPSPSSSSSMRILLIQLASQEKQFWCWCCMMYSTKCISWGLAHSCTCLDI